MIVDIAIIAFLMFVAIALILLEIFFLPGITVAGIGGILFAGGGILLAYTESTLIGHITLAASVGSFGVAFGLLMRSNSFSRVALKTNIDSHLTSSRDLGIQPGDRGTTLSRLAPVGKVRIAGIQVEARSEDGLIDENTPVVVVGVGSNQILVKPVT